MKENILKLSYITPLKNFLNKKNKIKYKMYIHILIIYCKKIGIFEKFTIKSRKLYTLNNLNVLKSPNRHKKFQFNLIEKSYVITIAFFFEKVYINFFNLLLVVKLIYNFNLLEFNTLNFYKLQLSLQSVASL